MYVQGANLQILVVRGKQYLSNYLYAIESNFLGDAIV